MPSLNTIITESDIAPACYSIGVHANLTPVFIYPYYSKNKTIAFGLDYTNSEFKTRESINRLIEESTTTKDFLSYGDPSIYGTDDILLNFIKNDISLDGNANNVLADMYNESFLIEEIFTKDIPGIIIVNNSVELINKDKFYENEIGVLFSNKKFIKEPKRPNFFKKKTKESELYVNRIIAVEFLYDIEVYVFERERSLSILSRNKELLNIQDDNTGVTVYIPFEDFLNPKIAKDCKRTFSTIPTVPY